MSERDLIRRLKAYVDAKVADAIENRLVEVMHSFGWHENGNDIPELIAKLRKELKAAEKDLGL